MSHIKVGKVEIKTRSKVPQTVPVTKPQTGGQKKEYTAAPANLSSLQTSRCVIILRWIVVILSIIHLTQCVQFGPDNSYTCHCFNDEPCNKDTGYCSGGCDIGWSGASCQKQNVALNKPLGQIKINRTRRKAADKTTNVPKQCSNTDMTRKWWGIDLLEEYPIKHIIIQPNRDVTSVNGISLYVIKENEEPELCYKERVGSSPKPIVKDIECNQVITGRYVNISNDVISSKGRYLTFCQVEIYVCSVGTFGSDCTNFCHCLNNERCSETGECPSGCHDGWTGTTCSQVCGNGTYGAGCLKLCSERNCLVETSPCNHINGGCERGCTEGFYGEVCDMKCSDRKCKDSNLQCESKTGECIDGCQPGYQTIDCTRVCDDGTYGAGCSKLCSERNCLVETSPCNHINGSCEGGCTDGFYGEVCDMKCSDRNCKDSNLQCESKTGECIDGCQPGYQTLDCTRECDNGTYGPNCMLDCSARFCNLEAECNNIDGACNCSDGYQGIDCTIKQEIVLSIGDNRGTEDQSPIMVTILVAIIVSAIIAGVIVVLIVKKRSRGNRSSYDVTQPETALEPLTIEQP